MNLQWFACTCLYLFVTLHILVFIVILKKKKLSFWLYDLFNFTIHETFRWNFHLKLKKKPYEARAATMTTQWWISQLSEVSTGKRRWSMQPWCEVPMSNRGHGCPFYQLELDPDLRNHIEHCQCTCNHMGYGNFLDYQVHFQIRMFL